MLPRTLSASILVAFALGQDVDAQTALREQAAVDTSLIGSEAFLRRHPDLRYRKSASEAYERGHAADAFGLFRRAARYGDKLSQARVAEMLWYGDGTGMDRAMAYVWMDLAAERGYLALLAWRERYWEELEDDERQRALLEGPAIYAEYGDEVAKPRLERELKRGLRAATGGRVGNPQARNMSVAVVDRSFPDLAGALQFGKSFRAERFYDPVYWQPELYWRWQAAVFEKAATGEVEIGVVEPSD